MWSGVNGTTVRTNDNETGGVDMFSINRIFIAGAVVSAAAAVFMASGCGVAGGMHRGADVRVATRLEAGSPKMIVSGPARLLHVDVHGRQALSIYSVKRGTDGTVSCADKARAEPLPLRQGASNELNLVVREGEAICLANDANDVAARNADVSWHARRGADAPAETAHASNL
jgi:hypothetical protein